ncbi:hypothetical protein DPMN_164404 [Dreissena polymorpha]|uniref:Uncharacterized protein n=1 Tax=Dreissena polymorpha TaxID=45954 RepID=A0A9D4EVV9_DREPO|nr:hypothetical protein DPMN_164404 [Dreissena polymorpha]
MNVEIQGVVVDKPCCRKLDMDGTMTAFICLDLHKCFPCVLVDPSPKLKDRGQTLRSNAMT